jgi:ElaB/YqjD/DUF883 family membrane-anchored ribosome-binding protein
MAEESNELTRVSDDGESPDAPATAVGATNTYQTSTLGAYPNTDDERSRELDANTTSETPEEPEQIRAQIEATRSQMGETIDAIQEKLSLSNITEQVKETVSEHITSAVETAKDAVYGATIGKAGDFMQNVGKSFGDMTGNMGESLSDAGTSVYRTARRNPLPFALIAAGVGLLILQNRRSGNGGSYARSYRYDYDAGNYIDEGNESYSTGGKNRRQKSTLNTASKKVSNAASSAYEGVTGAASSAYSGVSDAANSAYQGLTSAAGTAYEQVGNVGTQARRVAGQAQDQYEYYLEENPLAVGAVALAVGAAVGFMLPSTSYEGALMGEYRDNLVQKASDAARDAYGKVQQVASEVGGKVQEVAGEAIRTAREEAKNQDLIQ